MDQTRLGTEAVLLAAAGYIESSAYDGKLTMLDMCLGGRMNRQTRVNTSSQMFVMYPKLITRVRKMEHETCQNQEKLNDQDHL